MEATTKRVFTNKFASAVCERCGKSIDIGHPISWKRRQEGEKRSHVWHHPMCPGDLNYATLAGTARANATDEEINEANEAIQQDAQQTQGYNLQAVRERYGKEEWLQNWAKAKGYVPQTMGLDQYGEAFASDEGKRAFSGAPTKLDSEDTSEYLERAQEAVKANGGHSDAMTVLRDLGKILDPFMGPKQAPIDEKTVERIVTRTLTKDLDMHIDEALKGRLFQTVTTVKLQDVKTNETKDLGLQHKQFPKLLELASCRVDVWLPGPAGSGKTTASENVAKALGLKFFHVGAMDSDYKLMGFVDAQGRIVHTLFREWFINGGVICLDEVDSWLPSATLALNAALANGHCTFPDGMFQRHPDSVVIACANTFGLGDSTTDYTGRMKQDAAFLDRFVQLAWEYDESFELALVIATHGAELANKWVPRVQAIRQKCKAQGLRVVISPRASIKGALLLAHGMEQDFVEQVCLRKGMSRAQWTNVC